MLLPTLLASQTKARYDDSCLTKGEEHTQDDGSGHVNGWVINEVEEAKEGVVGKYKDEATDKNNSGTEENSHDTSNHEGGENIGKKLDTDD